MANLSQEFGRCGHWGFSCCMNKLFLSFLLAIGISSAMAQSSQNLPLNMQPSRLVRDAFGVRPCLKPFLACCQENLGTPVATSKTPGTEKFAREELATLKWFS